MTPQDRFLQFRRRNAGNWSILTLFYHLSYISNSALIAVLAVLCLLLVLFTISRRTAQDIQYPGGIGRVQPTVRVIIPASVSPVVPTPEIPTPPPLPLPPILEQPAPVEPQAPVGIEAPPIELQPPAVEQPVPTSEPPTSTPFPAPGDPGFAASFQPEPECNIFIGYVGPKRSQCQAVYDAQYHDIYATQTAEAQP